MELLEDRRGNWPPPRCAVRSRKSGRSAPSERSGAFHAFHDGFGVPRAESVGSVAEDRKGG